MSGSVEAILFWHWWTLAIVLMILEMLLPGFYFLWMSLSAAAIGFILLAAPALSWKWQVLFFSVLSVTSIALWRSYLRKHPISTDNPSLNRRGEQYLGRTFTLIQPIVNGYGKIKVDDTTWPVHGNDLEAGTKVRVTGVKGIVLSVEAIGGKTNSGGTNSDGP